MVPYHICVRLCALYETVQVVNAQHDIYDQSGQYWQCKKKKINI